MMSLISIQVIPVVVKEVTTEEIVREVMKEVKKSMVMKRTTVMMVVEEVDL